MPSFDQHFWQEHWQAYDAAAHRRGAPNPYLVELTRDLSPGTALDAGCGTGTEALWLTSRGWQVTAADISAEALAIARQRAAAAKLPEPTTWVEADLTTWEPEGGFDLVVTHYAHPSMPQLAFYRRIAEWVAPGGTLIVVGHLPGDQSDQHHGEDHGRHHPPHEATATAAAITGDLDAASWRVDLAEELTRPAPAQRGQRELRDVVVRATRRGP